MALIYSSFSQINENILQNLIGEYTDLMDYFNSKEIKAKVDFQAAYGKPVNAITSEIIEHQKDLKIFHYSGHSDSEGLNFTEKDFEKEHVIQFFNTLNSHEVGLDCVFLNGCTNEAIVQRLTQVPVVIGTKSPIRNDTAIKFTNDFFKALISGKQTYEAAFTQASSALPASSGGGNIVRGIGWNEQTDQPKLDEYFMVINDPKVAERSFPLKKKKANWLIYIAILLTILGGIWTYLNWDTFFTQAKGYDCPAWQDEEKCNVLVIDFNEADYNEFISEAINTNPVMNKYMEGDYRIDYSELIPDDSDMNEKELPRKCDFEYLMTGDVGLDDEGKKMMAVEMIPYLHKERVIKEIGSLWGLKERLLAVRDIFKENYVISQVCVACAATNENIMAIADEMIEKLVNEKGAEEAYQELNEDMGLLYLQREDTTKAILALKKVAFKDINDKALAAREESGDLETKMGDFENAYLSHSRYITSVEMRMEYPQNYEMSHPITEYGIAQKAMMLKRANLVIEHPERLSMHRRKALQDFRFLQKEKFQNRDFSQQIRILCEILGEQCEEENDEIIIDSQPFNLKVRTQSGARINEVIVNYQGQQFRPIDGIISIPCINNDCIGEEVRIEANEYQSKELRLRGESKTMSVILEKVAPPKVKINGKVVTQNNDPISGTSMKFGDRKRITDSRGNFDFGEFIVDQLPSQKIYITKSNFYPQEVSVKNLLENRNITLERIPVETIEIYGNILTQDGKAIRDAVINFGQQEKATDRRGSFDFGKFVADQLPSQKIYITKSNFYPQEVSVKKLLENRTITLLPEPELQKIKYVITGKVNDCNYRTTVLKEIFIDQKTVAIKEVFNTRSLAARIKETHYFYEIETTPGKQVNITLPRGYSFKNARSVSFTLGDNPKIIKNLNIIKKDEQRFKVKGQLIYGDKPVRGGQLILEGATARGAVTDRSGNFSFYVQGYFCQKIKVNYGVYQSKTFELRHFSPQGGSILLGNVEVK